MLLAGVTLSILFTNDYEENARRVFGEFFEQTTISLNDLQKAQERHAKVLVKRERLKSSLNLISEYADVNDYQAIIFDEEKRKIADMLFDFAVISRLGSVRVYDASGWLVAYAQTDGEGVKGITSFEGGAPIVYVDRRSNESSWEVVGENAWAFPIHSADRPDSITSRFMQTNSGIASELRAPVYRILPDGVKRLAGVIVLEKHIGAEFMATMSRHSIARHAIITADGNIAGDSIDRSALKNIVLAGSLSARNVSTDSSWESRDTYFFKAYSVPVGDSEKFYLVSYLDKEVLNEQVANTRYTFLAVFSIVAILLFPAGMIFLRQSIVAPIDNLVENARAIGEGRYDVPMQGMGSDELDVLASALRETAETIREREQQLRAAHDKLEQRVYERTEDLSAVNERLKIEMAQREVMQGKLQDSEAMLQLVIDNIPQYVFWKDIESAYLGCNANFLKVTGVGGVSKLLGKSDYDLHWTKEQADSYREIDQRVMGSGKPEFHVQEMQKQADGSFIYAESNRVPLRDKSGKVIGLLGTYEDVTERREAETMLISAKQQAEEANLARSEFLSRMSHELRTPLNAILGFAQVMKINSDSELSEMDQSCLIEITTAGKHLLQLIVEVLDLSGIESGNMFVDIGDVNFSELLAECMARSQAEARKRNITLRLDASKSFGGNVLADRVRLKQVLVNLIANAVKYNRDGGSVMLACYPEDDDRLRIEVIDTGVGIEKEQIGKLFTPFERLGAERTGIDGAGIGLLLCKQLIELMGGQIGVESKSGVGTTVWISIPLSGQEKSGQQEVSEAIAVSSAAEISVAGADTDTDADADADAEIMVTKKIVYIEDNLANLRFMQKVLQSRKDLELHCAEDALEGIEMVRHEQPGLVLMDIQMPGMDGYEAFSVLQESADTKSIPVVAVSANAMDADIKHAYNIGFSGYITKPINIRLLLDTIENFLNK